MSLDDPDKSIRIRSTRKPADRPQRTSKAKRPAKPRVKGTPSMERKYQWLTLIHSGKASLADLKSQYRLGYVAAEDEYSSIEDQKDFLNTKARVEKLMRLTETRDMAKQRMIMMMTPKPKLTGNRADAISRFATGFRGSDSWKRYPPMVLTPKKYNPPRYGSSKGYIGKTEYHGFKKFNKDFDAMIRSLLTLTGNKGVTGKQVAARLTRIKAGITTTVKG